MRFNLLFVLIIFSLLIKGQGGFQREYLIPGMESNFTHAIFETTPKIYLMTGISVEMINGRLVNRLALFGINKFGQRTWTKIYGNDKFQYLDGLNFRKWYKQGDFIYYATQVRDSNDLYSGVFVKFNFEGDTIWQRKYYDNEMYYQPKIVCGSVDNGFLLTGKILKMSLDSTFILLIKTDGGGNELWRKKIKTSSDHAQGSAILQDSLSKKIIIAGYTAYGGGTKDAILICDSVGNLISEHSYCSVYGHLWDMVQTKDKNVVAVGRVMTKINFCGSDGYSYAVKFNPNNPVGPIWKIIYFDKLGTGNIFTSIRELKDETLLLAGLLDTMVCRNNGPRLAIDRLSKISKSGNVIWNRYYNYCKDPTKDHMQGINSLEIASNGDWLTAVEYGAAPLGSPNPFRFVRYDSTGCDSSVAYCMSVGLEERKNVAAAISVYPNPIKSFIHLNFSKLNFPVEELGFKLFDVTGRLLRQEEIKIEEDEASIPAGELDRGVYFLQLYQKDKLLATKKIIKE